MMGARSPRLASVALAIVATILLAGALLLAMQDDGFAQQDPYSERSPSVKPSLIVQNSDPEPEADIVRDGLLPFTGGGVTAFVLAGGTAIAVGTMLTKARRRQ